MSVNSVIKTIRYKVSSSRNAKSREHTNGKGLPSGGPFFASCLAWRCQSTIVAKQGFGTEMAMSEATTGKMASRELEARIHQVTRQIPAGQVATYGQIGLVAGANSARRVGRAMSMLPAGSDVPWHRVI